MPLQGLKDFFFRDRFLTRSNLIELALGVVVIAGLGAVFDSLTRDILLPIFSLLGGAPDFSAIRLFGIGIGGFIMTFLTFLIRIAILYFLIVFPLNYFVHRRSSGE